MTELHLPFFSLNASIFIIFKINFATFSAVQYLCTLTYFDRPCKSGKGVLLSTPSSLFFGSEHLAKPHPWERCQYQLYYHWLYIWFIWTEFQLKLKLASKGVFGCVWHSCILMSFNIMWCKTCPWCPMILKIGCYVAQWFDHVFHWAHPLQAQNGRWGGERETRAPCDY